MNRPIPFITLCDDEKFHISPDAEDMLKKMNDKAFAVLAIGGPSRFVNSDNQKTSLF